MDSNDIDWKSDSEKELDRELENEALELDLKINGGEIFKNDETPPELYNEFLKNVKEYESLSEQILEPVRSIFPKNYYFPPVTELTEEQILEKLNDIEAYFNSNNIQLALSNRLPKKNIYQYIKEEVLDETPAFPYGPDCRFTYVIDGCDGYCPGCFQRDFCEGSEAWD